MIYPTKPKTSQKYLIIIISIVPAMIIIGMALGLKAHHSSDKRPLVAPSDVITNFVEIDNNLPLVTLAGVAEPIRRATPSARIMAKVISAQFQDGQRVKANQILVRLDTRDLSAKHKQASAGEGAATTALEVAEANLRRMRSLVEAGAASQTQLEAVEVVTAQARAATKTARAAIDEVDVNVSYASVASPFDGIVVQKMTEAGNIVGPGQPLFIVEDDSRLRIIASVGMEDASRLASNQSVRVKFGQETCTGVVESVISSGDTRAPGLRVQVLVDNPKRHYRAGTLAVVEIPGQGATAKNITIPKDAVVERGHLTGVFVVGEDHTAKLRWLILGDRKGDRVSVLSGLGEKDRVIVNPSPNLYDGQVVQEHNQ